MKSIQDTAGASPQWGVEPNSTLHPLSRLPDGPLGLGDLANPSYCDSVRRALRDGVLSSPPADDVRRLALVPRPGQIVCLGLKYYNRVKKENGEVPEQPLLFAKSPSSVTNSDDLILDPAGADEVDYEVDLGTVVARNIDAASVRDHVASYTIVNYLSLRDAQFDDCRVFSGKSYYIFALMGIALVIDDSVDPNTTDVELRVNDHTKEFTFDLDEVVSQISGVTTLRPGNVIWTRTPGNGGIFRDLPDLLVLGDTIEAEVEDIGIVKHLVVAANGDR